MSNYKGIPNTELRDDTLGVFKNTGDPMTKQASWLSDEDIRDILMMKCDGDGDNGDDEDVIARAYSEINGGQRSLASYTATR